MADICLAVAMLLTNLKAELTGTIPISNLMNYTFASETRTFLTRMSRNTKDCFSLSQLHTALLNRLQINQEIRA